MKVYEVDVREVSYGWVVVEARNKEEAREKALDAMSDGMATMGGDLEFEIGDITEIDSN